MKHIKRNLAPQVVRVVRRPQDATLDYFIPLAEARRLYDAGKLYYCLDTTSYVSASGALVRERGQGLPKAFRRPAGWDYVQGGSHTADEWEELCRAEMEHDLRHEPSPAWMDHSQGL